MRKQCIASDEVRPASGGRVHDDPCGDCPFARTALRGWLGHLTPLEWVGVAHSEATSECHVRLGSACAGLAIYRANVSKMPRDPSVRRLPADRDRVFATPDEFLDHHFTRPQVGTFASSPAAAMHPDALRGPNDGPPKVAEIAAALAHKHGVSVHGLLTDKTDGIANVARADLCQTLRERGWALGAIAIWFGWPHGVVSAAIALWDSRVVHAVEQASREETGPTLSERIGAFRAKRIRDERQTKGRRP